MKAILSVTAFVLCISMNTISQTQTIVGGTLTFNIVKFSHDNGKAVVMLFKKDDDYPTKPFMKISSIIANGKSEIIFTNIPYGEYAAIIFHDENSNDTLDHNFLGLPKEPMGFSNGWKLTLFSGMPSFAKLNFEFSVQKPNINIDID